MKDLINSIIKNQVNKYFEFELTEGNSVKKLKKATKLVPNLSGIYLVFSEGLNESTHLNFKISNKNYSLLYYGKAGGKTNSGRVIVQGLNSRINNVVSDTKRGMKDVKRAKYWNEIMLEFGIEKLYVVFHIHDAPQQLENIIYDYLDSNNLEYPLMNKKRGRLSKKNKSEILKKNDNVSVYNKISKQIKKTKNLISKPIKLQNSNSKESVYGSCVEFQLARNENIATIANGISNLHVGPCSIELFYKNSNDVRLYINNGKRNIRTKNRTISEYFNSPDTKNGNIPKWQIVQNEMNEPNRKIEEITVRVCSNGNQKEGLNISKNEKKIFKKTNSFIISKDTLKLSKNFKVVMVCSGGKNESHFSEYPKINFVNESTNELEFHPDELINGEKKSWREYLLNSQKDDKLLEAYNLYKRNQYKCLYKKYKNNFYILSAGWGLINSDFKLPKYDITFSKKSSQRNKRNNSLNEKPIYKDFNYLSIKGGEDIVYMGGKEYLNLFYELTKNISNRKIIYIYNHISIPAPPNESFLIRSYFINYPSFWYYQLANDFCNDIIP